MRLLLPYLLHGVGVDSQGGGVSPDYRTASHMILVQLCSIATLAKDFLEGEPTLFTCFQDLQCLPSMTEVAMGGARMWMG